MGVTKTINNLGGEVPDHAVAWCRIRGDAASMDAAFDNFSRWSAVHRSVEPPQQNSHLRLACGRTSPDEESTWGGLVFGNDLPTEAFWVRGRNGGQRYLRMCGRCWKVDKEMEHAEAAAEGEV